jgi:hypothetical protein
MRKAWKLLVAAANTYSDHERNRKITEHERHARKHRARVGKTGHRVNHNIDLAEKHERKAANLRKM